jgi:D-cysteine desulfhydrase
MNADLIHPREPARMSLAQLPTPIVKLNSGVLMKRDDLTGLEVSGNKVRKLEYVVADALQQQANTLVTHGGFQSNHCRATAAIAARLGLRCRLLLRAPDNPANDGNLFLDRMFGAAISLHPPAEYAERQRLIDTAMAEERAAGHRPYFFPVGASIPLGCWGYIRCVHEIVEQLGRSTPIDLFAPLSSSGTIAGLILGRTVFHVEPSLRVVGIPVSDSVEFFQADIRKLIDETIRAFDLDVNVGETPIELLDGYIGEGYAIPTPQAIETLRTIARTEGILLDPTYTAKAMAGFVDQVQQGKIRPGARAVFLHTGGVFGLMARRDLFE